MSSCGITRMYEGLFGQRAIYLSDSESAHDLNLLKKLKITAVLSVAKQLKIDYPKSIVSEYLHIAVIDSEDYDIESIFDRTFQFIESMHLERNVLIHCAFGVSRSAAVFIAYRIRKHGQSLENAISISRKRRPIINPNKGFMKALERYSEKHHKKQRQNSPFEQRYKDKLKLSRSSLKRKRSLPQSKLFNCENSEQREKQLLFFSEKREEAFGSQLSQINTQKQLIEQKLQQIRSYYQNFNRGKPKNGLAKLSSVQYKREANLDCEFLQKNLSAQI